MNAKQLIGRIIRMQREKRNLSLQELADLLGVDRQYVWRLENGRINMTLDYLDKVITQLKCKREDFFNNN
jgi:transcriptional regulator with XRE-family HTH domain